MRDSKVHFISGSRTEARKRRRTSCRWGEVFSSTGSVDVSFEILSEKKLRKEEARSEAEKNEGRDEEDERERRASRDDHRRLGLLFELAIKVR